MAIPDHLSTVKCPECKVYTFRATGADGRDVVFCSICGAGGDFEEVAVKGGNLTGGFVSPDAISEFMRKIRPTDE